MKPAIQTSLCALLLLTAGCSIGPDFVRPETDTAETFSESFDSRLSTDPAEYGLWWTVFEDPTLEKLVQMAGKNNLPLQIAAARILEARAALGIASGLRYPQQQMVGQAARIELSENAPNAAIANQSFSNYNIGFDASWEMDVWGRLGRGVEAANADVGRELAGYDNSLVTVTAETARSYILLRTFEARLGLARENAKIQNETLRIAKVRFENGAVTELDVTQARALLRDTEASIPRLETGVRQTMNAISTLIGQPPGQLAELLKQGSSIPTAPAEIAIGVPVDLLRRRPDIRIAELKAAAQSARIGIAESELYPRFSLFGAIGLETSSQGGSQSNNAGADDLFSSDSMTYKVGPSFSWPILSHGRIRNNIRVQEARFEQAALNYQQTVLEAAREVEDALAAYLRNQRSVDYLTASVNDARRSVELGLIQYRAGSVTYQRVLDTQRFLVRQEDQLARTQGDVALSLVATFKALGGGWETQQTAGERHED